MLEPIFNFIEKLASDFSWRKVVILVSLIFLVAISWLMYESQTSTNQLAKYERTVAILEKLEMLNLNDDRAKEVAKNIYHGLNSITKNSGYQISFVNSLSLESRQALFAASPWIIVMLFYIPGMVRGETEAKNSVWALIFLSLLIGGVGYFIPVNWGILMYPLLGNFLFLCLIAAIGVRLNKNKRS